MNIGVIIQARMGSTRLPGKVMLKLGQNSILAHVIKRAQSIKSINKVIVATTNKPEDDIIEKEALLKGAHLYRGSESNVLERYYLAGKTFDLDIVIRITADCPLLDPTISGQILDRVILNNYDYSSNSLVTSFPRGLETEVFTFSALEQAYLQATMEYELEHVTPFIYQNPQLFHINSFENKTDYSYHRWTLDTEDDWILIQRIHSLIKDQDNYSWSKILNIVNKNRSLQEINAHVRQKELGE